ncbi:MAG: alternative ribosome rescue aminoacyl-tRNA hydrolase ArfB [Pseudomonadota bacterium]
MASDPLYINAGITIAGWELIEQFIRASGPGGQNVNKVATSVQLRFDARGSPALTERIKSNLARIAGRRMTKDGVVVIEADRHRTQERNRADARARLKEMIEKAAAPPPPKRKKTRPSKGAIERRLKAKSVRSGIKKMRSSVERE